MLLCACRTLPTQPAVFHVAQGAAAAGVCHSVLLIVCGAPSHSSGRHLPPNHEKVSAALRRWKLNSCTSRLTNLGVTWAVAEAAAKATGANENAAGDLIFSGAAC